MSRSAESDLLRQRIGARVFTLRQQRGLTALELSKRCGMHRNTIYRIESALNPCLVVQLWKIARALDVEMGYFFDDSPLMVQNACEAGKSG